MKKSINIAILGLGTVGFGVYDIIQKSPYLKNIVVKKILDKDKTKKELVDNSEIVSDYNEILNDNDIEIIIETMGAGDFSYKCIKEALINAKSVITANKEVIALHIDELTKLKEEYNVSLLYEATVGGGIPIISQLYEAVKINEINEVYGILNGTSNFILTKIFKDKMNFNSALKLAQEKGFAEADPTADLEGLDMVRKIAILSDIAYSSKIDINDIHHFGITNLSKKDIEYIIDKSMILKLVASSKKNKDLAEIVVEPVLMSNNIMSSVNEEYNIISIDCSYNGILKFYGKGAGRYPTANAIINDLISIIEKKKNYSFISKNELRISDLGIKSKYYLRYVNNSIEEKYLSREELKSILSSIAFYARIID